MPDPHQSAAASVYDSGFVPATVLLAMPPNSPFAHALMTAARRRLYQLGYHKITPCTPGQIQTRIERNAFPSLGCITMISGGRHEPDWPTLDIPVVNLSGQLAKPPVPTVTMDNVAIGRLAAEYFIDRGYRRLGWVARTKFAFDTERLRGYRKRSEEAGIRVQVTTPKTSHKLLANSSQPIAVFVGHDTLATAFIDRAHRRGRRVPDDVAVLGVNNDTSVCDSYPVTISSIDPGTRMIGTRAATLLHELIDGADPPKDRILIPPVGVVERASSSAIAVADPVIRVALQFIAEHAASPITTDDILAVLPVSRRTFEKRFKAALDRTPRAHLHRVRLKMARDMLVNTDLPIDRIAERTGHSNLHRFYQRFKEDASMTPGDYRKQFQ